MVPDGAVDHHEGQRRPLRPAEGLLDRGKLGKIRALDVDEAASDGVAKVFMEPFSQRTRDLFQRSPFGSPVAEFALLVGDDDHFDTVHATCAP